jgi:hypothetical protein
MDRQRSGHCTRTSEAHKQVEQDDCGSPEPREHRLPPNIQARIPCQRLHTWAGGHTSHEVHVTTLKPMHVRTHMHVELRSTLRSLNFSCALRAPRAVRTLCMKGE